MKKNFLILNLLLFNFAVFAQNYIYHGSKKFSSTSTWDFKINGISWGHKLEVSIGNDNGNGILLLKTSVTPDSYIGGNIYIFLSDGSQITCTDKKIRDRVDNMSVVLYRLTPTEIEKMKTNRISRIRFTIQPSSHEGFNGNKTADNKTYTSLLGSDDDFYHTDKEISILFK